ncbi:MAG: hypothetical protein M3123_04025, partial [Actinomycetota bacterium]|nr:hypothetical protein [Actinomycetota bacterium]
SELDRVPAIDTMVVSPEEAARVFAPKQPQDEPGAERSTGRRVLVAAAVLVVLALIAALVAWWLLA